MLKLSFRYLFYLILVMSFIACNNKQTGGEGTELPKPVENITPEQRTEANNTTKKNVQPLEVEWESHEEDHLVFKLPKGFTVEKKQYESDGSGASAYSFLEAYFATSADKKVTFFVYPLPDEGVTKLEGIEVGSNEKQISQVKNGIITRTMIEANDGSYTRFYEQGEPELVTEVDEFKVYAPANIYGMQYADETVKKQYIEAFEEFKNSLDIFMGD